MGGRPLDDARLCEQARSGDVGAYEELVRRYQRLAYRTAYVVTRSAADAEDAAQEAFVKAYYALDRFRPGAPFRPWLMRIVVNEALNRKRAGSRQEGLALRMTQGRPSGGVAPSPEVAVLDAEVSHVVIAALNQMSEKDRLVVALRYFFELSEAEMAQVLECPVGTVKSRLSRALARLKEALPDE
ncbi:MAG TPA: RNA polymerase sigma factor [Actinomycetota bacterium]|nr:RNA polymerase sigma factor [Actinomycetota bacterium]